MRSILHSAYKAYMHQILQQTRDAMGVSQEEMAHILCMSSRAYAALETRTAACGLITLFIFVFKCCPDRRAFLDELFAALEDAMNTTNTAA